MLPPLKGTPAPSRPRTRRRCRCRPRASTSKQSAQFIDYFMKAENLAAVGQGDWLIPTTQAARDAVPKATGGKNGWEQIAGQRQRPDQGAVPERGRTTRSGRTRSRRRRSRSTSANKIDLATLGKKLSRLDGARSDQLTRQEPVTLRWTHDEATGALVGSAVGDALGGAVEGWTPEPIRERHGGWVDRHRRPVVRRLAHRPPDRAVPQGRRAHHRRHLDDARAGRGVRRAPRPPRRVRDRRAPGPDDADRDPRWIPELETEALLLQRVFLAEKWLVARLHYGHVDPREAGVGNIVNCGAAMYMAPVGIVNAGDPAGAYAEAIDLAGAHQSSYGREAAGRVRGRRRRRDGARARRLASVVDAALALAKDGTRSGRSRRSPTAADGVTRLGAGDSRCCARRSSPYDTVGPDYRAPVAGRPPAEPAPRRSRNCRSPSASCSSPAATTPARSSAACNYGRDADSIATMAGAITGALGGTAAVPADWADDGRRGQPHRPGRAGGARWPRWPGRSAAADAERAAARRATPARSSLTRRSMIRLTWVQPEDLLAARTRRRRRRPRRRPTCARAGSRPAARRGAAGGASPDAAGARRCARSRPELLAARRRARRARPSCATREPDDLAAIEPRCAPGLPSRAGRGDARPAARRLARPRGRLPARQAGGEDPARRHPGDRPSRPATGRCAGYFTAIGLDPTRSPRRWPWNRRSARPACAENIDGMPEDDDLNYPLLALHLLERHGRRSPPTTWRRRGSTTSRPAACSPPSASPTATSSTASSPPETARRPQPVPRVDRRADPHRRLRLGAPGRPGAPPGSPGRRQAQPHRQRRVRRDVRAAAPSAARGAGLGRRVLAAGLVGDAPGEPLAAAVRFGVALGAGRSTLEAALDALHAEYGDLHWVHALNNAALVASALRAQRRRLRPARSRRVVAGGWDTDSNGATVGSVCGALAGAGGLPAGVDGPAAQPAGHQRRPASTASASTTSPGARHGRLACVPGHAAPRLTAPRLAPRRSQRSTVFIDRSPHGRSTCPTCSRSTARSTPPAPSRQDLRRPGRPRRLAGVAAPAAPVARRRPRAARLRPRGVRACHGALGEHVLRRRDRVAVGRAAVRPRPQEFTPDTFLADAVDRFGGFDAVVLWHAYPVIGIDARNQFDFYRDVPGLAELVDAFQRRGVRVFVDYNPWDTGTATSTNTRDDWRAGRRPRRRRRLPRHHEGGRRRAARALAALDPPSCSRASPRCRRTDRRPPVTWAQWFADSPVPGVLRAHWFERRHMMHHTRRWNRDHSDELQSSWVNGAGMLVWDAVFGAWVGWNARDASTLRRMRRRSARSPTCCSPATGHRSPTGRPPRRRRGVRVPVLDAGRHALDRGQPRRRRLPGRRARPRRRRRRRATGHVARPRRRTTAHRRRPVGDGAGTRRRRDRRRRRATAGADRRGPRPPRPTPTGRHDLPGARRRPGVRRPCRPAPRPATRSPSPAARTGCRSRTVAARPGCTTARPYVDEWKPLPPRLHDTVVEEVVVTVRRCAVAAREVTNGEYADFLAATGYRPLVANRFLRHWVGRRAARRGAPAPVTFVDLDDARAYAAWVGARLPTEFEWQLAAEAAGARFERLSRWCGTGPRASTATASPASPSSRAGRRTTPRRRSGTSTGARGRRRSRPSCCSPGSASSARRASGSGWRGTRRPHRRRGRERASRERANHQARSSVHWCTSTGFGA